MAQGVQTGIINPAGTAGSFTNPTITGGTITGAAISGGSIDNVVIGGTTPAEGNFTDLIVSDSPWADIRAYGAVVDGVTDDTAAVIAAIAANSGEALFPRGTTRITANVALSNNTKLRFAQGAQILKDFNGTLFSSSGTMGTRVAMTNDVLRGVSSMTLPTGEGVNFNAGDWIGIQSDVILVSSDGKPREIHKIAEVVGDIITLEEGVSWNYLVSDNSQFFTWIPVENIEIEGGEITCADPTGADQGITFSFENSANIRINKTVLTNCGGGIGFVNCQDVKINQIEIDRLPNYGDPVALFGYGIWVFGASANVIISDGIFHDTRHAFTTLAAGAETYGLPQDILLDNCIGTASASSLSIFDTHAYGYRIKFNNCHAIGAIGLGTNGFQIRSPNTELIGCTAMFHGIRGVIGQVGASNLRIIGGEFAYNAVNGISSASDKTLINGSYLHHNTTSGANVGLNAVVENCLIEDNAFGIQDSGSTNCVYQNNVIPASGIQTIGILTPSATSVVKGNTLKGYAGLNLAIRNPVAGAVIKNNIGYLNATYGAAAAVSDGGIIVHGLESAPTSVRVTPSVSGQIAAVTAIDATDFTVALKVPASLSTWAGRTNADLSTIDTEFFPLYANSAPSASIERNTLVSVDGVISGLLVSVSAAPDGVAERQFIVAVNGLDSIVTCNIVGAATSAEDIINTVAVVRGDRVSIKTIPVGTPVAAEATAALTFTVAGNSGTPQTVYWEAEV